MKIKITSEFYCGVRNLFFRNLLKFTTVKIVSLSIICLLLMSKDFDFWVICYILFVGISYDAAQVCVKCCEKYYVFTHSIKECELIDDDMFLKTNSDKMISFNLLSYSRSLGQYDSALQIDKFKYKGLSFVFKVFDEEYYLPFDGDDNVLVLYFLLKNKLIFPNKVPNLVEKYNLL